MRVKIQMRTEAHSRPYRLRDPSPGVGTEEREKHGLLVSALVIALVLMAALFGGCGYPAGVSSTAVSRPDSPAVQTATGPTAGPTVTGPAASLPVSTGLVGAPGLGDPYFPLAGNEGYDVSRYELALQIDPQNGALRGQVSVTAIATKTLGAFNLDLEGLTVSKVRVDGRGAVYQHAGGELTVVPVSPLPAGCSFQVDVEYSGIPQPLREEATGLSLGWLRQGDTIYTLNEPQGAATWFPVNDHPSDKALYRLRLTVPEPFKAVAGGTLVETKAGPAGRTFVWDMSAPMASYVAGVVVGRLQADEPQTVDGVTIRNFYAEGLVEQARPAFARTPEMLEFFAELFGPYPFSGYGAVVPRVGLGGAMENQTLSLFGGGLVEKRFADAYVAELFISHELAHQWFGNSVTLASWKDIWLNEGFATYASWLWLEHSRGPETLTEAISQSRKLLETSEAVSPGDPGPRHLFGPSVYHRGALTLAALRKTVGEEDFFKILREWARRYAYGNASTADFIALVKEVVGTSAAKSGTTVLPGPPSSAELDALFDRWLYRPELPGS